MREGEGRGDTIDKNRWVRDKILIEMGHNETRQVKTRQRERWYKKKRREREEKREERRKREEKKKRKEEEKKERERRGREREEKTRREEREEKRKGISSGTFCKFSAGADEVIVEVIVCVVCKSWLMTMSQSDRCVFLNMCVCVCVCVCVSLSPVKYALLKTAPATH